MFWVFLREIPIYFYERVLCAHPFVVLLWSLLLILWDSHWLFSFFCLFRFPFYFHAYTGHYFVVLFVEINCVLPTLLVFEDFWVQASLLVIFHVFMVFWVFFVIPVLYPILILIFLSSCSCLFLPKVTFFFLNQVIFQINDNRLLGYLKTILPDFDISQVSHSSLPCFILCLCAALCFCYLKRVSLFLWK